MEQYSLGYLLRRCHIIGIDLLTALERTKSGFHIAPISSEMNDAVDKDNAEPFEEKPRRGFGGRRVFSDRSSIIKIPGRIVYVFLFVTLFFCRFLS
jgi:hypothetical protein